MLSGEQHIMGSAMGTGNPMVGFPELVGLAMPDKQRTKELVTRRYRIDEADEAFRAVAAGEQARGPIGFLNTSSKGALGLVVIGSAVRPWKEPDGVL